VDTLHLGAGGKESPTNRETTPNPRFPSFPRAAFPAAADAGADADGEEASLLQQPRKHTALPPSRVLLH
jgi:hypothetical protein